MSMIIPIQNKPEIEMRYAESVMVYENAISITEAKRLINFALDVDVSGLNRRGSKNPETTDASFSTCLIYNHDDPIYELTNPLWESYINNNKSNLTFIEPYELKLYYSLDKFNYHQDGYGTELDRKINLIIQLSDESEYEGGELYVGDFLCPKKFGTAIFFPAHYKHCVTEVTNGRRCSLIGHGWGPVYR